MTEKPGSLVLACEAVNQSLNEVGVLNISHEELEVDHLFSNSVCQEVLMHILIE